MSILFSLTNNKADPIWAYNGSSHVIYLRSFSKVMLPGLRLAAATVPKALIPSLLQHKRTADLSTSVLSQGVLEIFIQSGMYEQGGLFCTLNLQGIHTEELVKRLSIRGVDVLPADQQFLSSFPKMNLLRMSIMRTE